MSLQNRRGTIRAREPFVFRRSLDFIVAFGHAAGEQRVDGGTLTKAIMADGEVVVFRAREAESPGVEYELFSERGLSDEAAALVEERISSFLSLDDAVGDFYEIALADPEYYPRVEALWGLHQVKFPSLLEVSAWAIIAQRVQRSVALRTEKALVERYGETLEVEGVEYRAFPDYARLKGAGPSELLALTRNQRTAERLGSLLANFEELDEGFLRTAPYPKAVERLQKVKGIGEWSAQFIMFRGLGRIERQDHRSKPVVEMMKEVYGEGRTLEDVNRMYGKWCGYWSLYLWAYRMAASSR